MMKGMQQFLLNAKIASLDYRMMFRNHKSVKIRKFLFLLLLVVIPSSQAFTTPASSLMLQLHQHPKKLNTANAISNLDISIDTPLLPPSSPDSYIKGIISSIFKDSPKVLVAAWMLLFIFSFRKKFLVSLKGLNSFLKSMGQKVQSTRLPSLKGKSAKPEVLDYGKNGWGVCSFASKQRLGKSNYIQYHFDLPKRNEHLGLKLGQETSLCTLDADGYVAKGNFYTYSPKGGIEKKLGKFSLVLPEYKKDDPDTIEYLVGKENANMIRVLQTEFKSGDEIAVQPGKNKLQYRGEYTPVTDMVYIAEGTGIVPILDQVRAVLPGKQSSVKSVNVIWVNQQKENFDVVSDLLEAEYVRHKTKLAVDCIVDSLQYNSPADNSQIDDAVPEYFPGVMAVLSGPQDMQYNAMDYLTQERGYPEDCICLL